MKLAGCILALALVACDGGASGLAQEPPAGKAVAMRWAKTFSVVEREGYRIVDIRASIIDWGGAARGPEQHVRLVLAPHGVAAPKLDGDLRHATLVRVPVRRIAVNAGPHEAMLTALGVDERLVAVGGTFSYDDGIRARVLSGEIRQIGYGWHSPPELDVMLMARSDVFLMALGDLEHVDHLDRLTALGVAVVPTFIDAEPDYMGRVEYLRLIGMLTGREAEAERYVDMVQRRVTTIRELAAMQPRRSLLYAWYGGGDRWMATVRNAEAKLIRDAGGLNPLERPDDPDRDMTLWVGTETLLTRANHADCWVLRDDHSQPFHDLHTLRRFKAWRDGCLFAADGRMKPEVNAYDLYERGVIRPDLILADLVKILHPTLLDHEFTYIRPDALGSLR
jgi:iron complex transport system substrate-binding protein